MPLVAQAAGIQVQREACVGRLRGVREFQRHEARQPAGAGETQVGVPARRAGLRTFGEGPLLRAARLEQGVVESRDVEVAPARRAGVLAEDLAGMEPGEELWRVVAAGSSRWIWFNACPCLSNPCAR